MEFKEILNKRLQEVVTITKVIGKQSSEDKKRTEDIVSEIKSSGDSEEDRISNKKRVTEMKRINSFTFLKSNEIGINIRIMNEIYSLMKFLDIKPEISDADLETLDFNLMNVKPTFILDKGEVVFFEKQVEEFVLSQLEKTEYRDDEFIDKVKKFKENGKD